MCLLFFQFKSDPNLDEFALVVVNNRDESYARPTLVSHHWKECPEVVGGRDAFPGKEGGTWIGMSNRGKIGVLLSILQPLEEEDPDAKGRGHLVTNYLTSDVNSEDYLDVVVREGNLYNNFHLITMEVKLPFSDTVIRTYNNLSGDKPVCLQPGIHAIGNSLKETPYNKVKYGREKFSNIVTRHAKISTKDKLIEELVRLLNDDTTHYPDAQMTLQGRGRSKELLERMSAIKVTKSPANDYGTRSNTIILVDAQGNVDYVERTMEEPIDTKALKWIVTHHTFSLVT